MPISPSSLGPFLPEGGPPTRGGKRQSFPDYLIYVHKLVLPSSREGDPQSGVPAKAGFCSCIGNYKLVSKMTILWITSQIPFFQKSGSACGVLKPLRVLGLPLGRTPDLGSLRKQGFVLSDLKKIRGTIQIYILRGCIFGVIKHKAKSGGNT